MVKLKDKTCSILKPLRIVQAEGRNWRSEMDDFLMMYRSTPHSTTGVSPAELLFGRRIRTKLPQLQEFTVGYEVRDRDSERKEKGKVYADCKRNAQESKIQEGDKALLRQEKENKLSTTYKAWCMVLVYMSVTPCVCTNLFFRERHSFGARAQGKIQEGTTKAQFRYRQDTFLARFN